jgi:hypothetical protein
MKLLCYKCFTYVFFFITTKLSSFLTRFQDTLNYELKYYLEVCLIKLYNFKIQNGPIIFFFSIFSLLFYQ